MSITCSWQIGVDSEEWQARLQIVVRKRRVPATILPQAESLLRLTAHPLDRYVIGTEDDIVRSFEIGVRLARKWWEQGIGFPTIVLLTSAKAWEAKAQFSGLLPVSSVPKPLFDLIVYKELIDEPVPQAGFSFLSRFGHIDTCVRRLYYSSEQSSYGELLHRVASACRLQFSVWEPYYLLNESLVVIERHDVGGFITTAYHAMWREGLWRKPVGIVALAPEPLHEDLLSTRVEDRPIFLDVLTPEQLIEDGVVRVRRWRSDLETALRMFYARWVDHDFG